MRNKIVGIVILMLVTTTVVSATQGDVTKTIEAKPSGDVSLWKTNLGASSEPALFDWWCVDQKQTVHDRQGITLIPPETNAQSFTPTKEKLTAVSLYLFKHDTPPDPVHITVSIRDNLTGLDLATKTIDTSVVTIQNKATWVLFDFDDITITPESTYFIVCSGDGGDATNAYCWLFSYNDTYTRGEAWNKATTGSSWVQWSGLEDFCFKTYFRKPLDVGSVPSVTSLTNDAIKATGPSTAQTSMPGSWMQTQKLLASDGTANDGFCSVSLDGDTALIGAPGDGGKGSAYVFTRTGTTWTEGKKFTASDGQLNDEFGMWISLDGDTALIGAGWDDDNGADSGSAYVFIRDGDTWTQQQKLLALDGAAKDSFSAWAVSLSGDTALIGAYGDDDNGADSGSAYVFTRTGTTWTQQAKLLASDGTAEDWFGYTVSLDGDTALIGARFNDENGNNSGSAYVFTRSGTTWTQQAKLLASDGTAEDHFGASLSIDGDTALIGAIGDNNWTGAAYVFTRSGTTWTQQAKLLASDGNAIDCFSWPLTLDGDTAFIGAYLDDENGVHSGSAYIFTRTGTTWTEEQKLLASDGAAEDQFAVRIALQGDTALIGSGYDDDMGSDSGSVYVFTKSGADLTFSITGGLGVKVEITNDGASDANDIPWLIHVEGGILGKINKTVDGTVDIPAGKSVTVKTGLLLGFGAISIIANVAGKEQTAEGMQILVFSMIKK